MSARPDNALSTTSATSSSSTSSARAASTPTASSPAKSFPSPSTSVRVEPSSARMQTSSVAADLPDEFAIVHPPDLDDERHLARQAVRRAAEARVVRAERHLDLVQQALVDLGPVHERLRGLVH